MSRTFAHGGSLKIYSLAGVYYEKYCNTFVPPNQAPPGRLNPYPGGGLVATAWTGDRRKHGSSWRFRPVIDVPANHGWTLDDEREPDGRRRYRLEHAGRVALMAPLDEWGNDWQVGIVGQDHSIDYTNWILYNLTADVKNSLEALAPVVVIETPQPADVTADLAAALPDTGYRQQDNGGLVAGIDY